MTALEYHAEFRIRFADLLERSGITHQALAERLGLISHTSISAWLYGRAFPRTHHMRQLIIIFGVPAGYLMCTDNEDSE